MMTAGSCLLQLSALLLWLPGSSVRPLTNVPSNERHAAWSPDGSKIAFQSDRDGNPEIYVMNADGTTAFASFVK